MRIDYAEDEGDLERVKSMVVVVAVVPPSPFLVYLSSKTDEPFDAFVKERRTMHLLGDSR